MKKYYSFLLLIIFLATLVPSLSRAIPSFNTSNAKWTSSSQITMTGAGFIVNGLNGDSCNVTGDSTGMASSIICGHLENKLGSNWTSEYVLFKTGTIISESGSSIYPFLVVNKEDSSSGTIYFEYMTVVGERSIKREVSGDTLSVNISGEPGGEIGGGDEFESTNEKPIKITGKIEIKSRDGGSTPINPGKVTKTRLLFYEKFGTPFGSYAQMESNISQKGDVFEYEEVKIPNGAKMKVGLTYVLKSVVEGTDNYVNCIDGQDTKGLTSVVAGEVCSLTYSGLVELQIDKNGKITVTNGDTFEKTNSGKVDIYTLSRAKGINITIQEKLDSPLDKALSSTVKWLAGIVETGMKVTMNWVDSLLNATDDYVLGDGISDNKGMEPAWTKIRNISLTLLVMGLIIIAFANVFQVNIEQYGLNRMVPKIIVAIVMAYMSWVIVIFFFDVANIIQAQANALLGEGSGISLMGSISIQTPTSADIMAKMGAILVLIILLFGAWVCGIVLLFLLLLRVVMLSFLLAVAPLAMIANIMPFTANMYKKWWNEFFKWMFMGPIATAIIALGTIIATNTGFGTDTATYDESIVTNAAAPGSGVNLLVGILILAASMYMAATLPLKWGGNLMGKWAGAGKKIWGNTGGKILGGAGALAGMAGGALWAKTGIPGAKKIVSNKLSQMGANSEARAGNRLAQALSGGKLGTDSDVLRRQQEDAIISESGKNMGVSTATKGRLHEMRKAAKDGSWKQKAIDRELAARGEFALGFANSDLIDKNTGTWLSKDTINAMNISEEEKTAKIQMVKNDKREATFKAGAHLASLAGSDQQLETTVKEKAPEIMVAAAHSGNSHTKNMAYAKGMKEGVKSGESGKAGYDKRTQIFEHLEDHELGSWISEKDIEQGTGNKSSDKKRGHYQEAIARMSITPGPVSSTPGSNWTDENQTRFDG